jgi:hypothetical protein
MTNDITAVKYSIGQHIIEDRKAYALVQTHTLNLQYPEWHWWVCPDCGRRVSDRIIEELEYVIEAHESITHGIHRLGV